MNAKQEQNDVAIQVEKAQGLNEYFQKIDALNIGFKSYLHTHTGAGLNLDRLVLLAEFTQVYQTFFRYLRHHHEELRQEYRMHRVFPPLFLVTCSQQLVKQFIDQFELLDHARLQYIYDLEALMIAVNERLQTIFVRSNTRVLPLVLLLVVVCIGGVILAAVLVART
jgi:hypothetical protein